VRSLKGHFGTGTTFVLVISQKCSILESYGVDIRNVKYTRNKTKADFPPLCSLLKGPNG
jgi:hypothetical protein